MGIRNRISAIPRTQFDAANLVGGYLALGDPLPEAVSIIRIVNQSDADVGISYDGATAHDFVLADTVLQIEFQANSQPNSNKALLARGTSVYVNGVAGTGTIYLIGYFSNPLS